MFLACLLKNITFWAIVIETVYSGSEIQGFRDQGKTKEVIQYDKNIKLYDLYSNLYKDGQGFPRKKYNLI